jgi:hypothetical protein
MMPMPVMLTLRRSTKLSVIEGSVDEHGTASESTPYGSFAYCNFLLEKVCHGVAYELNDVGGDADVGSR